MTTPEDTFRRLKRVPIDTAMAIIARQVNVAHAVGSFVSMTAKEFVTHRLAKRVMEEQGGKFVSDSLAPYLEGTGWTIDELNQELQRMYDDNS